MKNILIAIALLLSGCFDNTNKRLSDKYWKIYLKTGDEGIYKKHRKYQSLYLKQLGVDTTSKYKY